MKIGILTHPLMLNYGGILQNYALQTALLGMGHKVFTINRQYDFSYPLSLHFIANYVKRLSGNFFKHRITRWDPNIAYTNAEYRHASININRFIERNIIRTRPVYDNDLSSIDDEYEFDCYVVGSDQVWVPGCCPMSFVPFSKREGVKKITYAASAGNVTWMDEEDLQKQCVELSKSFSRISVREGSLKIKAEKILGRKVDLVLDPTMLLSADKYKSLVPDESSTSDKIFTYVLDKTEEKDRIIHSLSEKIGLPIISGFTVDTSKRIKNVLPSVEDWLNGMNSSRYVITDSFHGCVFAIIFNKQFFVVINKNRGTERFNTLLSKFNLMDRVVSTPKDINRCINTKIDYKIIGKILEKERKNSLSFINDALK